RDFHVADMVAHRSVKTPTALADMIVEWYADEDARLLGYATRLKLAFTSKISAMQTRLGTLDGRIRSAMRSKFTAMEARVANLQTRIRSALRAKIAASESRARLAATQIRSALKTRISLMDSRLNVLEAKIRGADPRKIIERGYVLALDPAGAPMRTAGGRSPGDRISLMFPDGTLDCTVDKVTLRESGGTDSDK
ncbi:MAG: hypothetical protein LUD50_07805, partial [Clostridia bacterium]|nr:hypothetical protein [Clostridia bacterium]